MKAIVEIFHCNYYVFLHFTIFTIKIIFMFCEYCSFWSYYFWIFSWPFFWDFWFCHFALDIFYWIFKPRTLFSSSLSLFSKKKYKHHKKVEITDHYYVEKFIYLWSISSQTLHPINYFLHQHQLEIFMLLSLTGSFVCKTFQ